MQCNTIHRSYPYLCGMGREVVSERPLTTWLKPSTYWSTVEEVWTLCRIFKRISNYKRFTPDWKQQQPVVKQSFVDTSSKACSVQSEISDDQSNNVINFKKMAFPQKSIMNASCGGNLNYQVDQRNSYYNNSQLITTMPDQSPFTSSNSIFWNTRAEDQEYLFSHGNWDELKSVVDLAIDPRSLFGFK